MPAPQNTFKAALKRGEAQMGCWMGLADAYVAEITATAGFDWVLIDGEHAPNDLRSILSQLKTVQASASHPVVRLPVGETWMIKQALDIGAQSLLIPMVESLAQAKDLVAAVHYPPKGTRGVGAALGRASRFGAIEDYATTADAQICLLLQVENLAGLGELDDILKLDGVDGVFIGPADLSADMGFLGNAMHPKVIETINDAITRIKNAGKAPGILTTDPAFQKSCLDLGASFVATDVDVFRFANAIRQAASDAKALRDG
ncbi:2-keto-3-deoxy-L-rhamnonate aldolase [Roseibium polysiphoniae]|uniref:2-keto-3-deoxy-L-rhamnonate aldolase n=1 Tax=Roseibium polysiphoniae TaxID=2571221 RepID=A0A944GSJ2_9HYPH|nr:HpcH/HpaI aldolase/citrate lyase family protein [Roseibium polysiphoniae]MBS8259495.1 2-keto-3-deoxy-L-rhamnonate aldolase [Roseibium polysiphoniae]